MTEKKYYAVRNGRQTGLFNTWAECRKQIQGFPNAIYKSFKTLEEAKAYLDPGQETHLDDATTPIAYVDGSYRPDTHRFGYGGVILFNGEEHPFFGEVTDRSLASMHNVAGEIKGAQTAMDYAVSQGWPSIIIYHDYEGIAAWCTGAWAPSKPGTIAYRDHYRSLSGILTVEFRKVKGHSGDHWNDMADALAKKSIE